jgi:hypothetical protein
VALPGMVGVSAAAVLTIDGEPHGSSAQHVVGGGRV